MEQECAGISVDEFVQGLEKPLVYEVPPMETGNQSSTMQSSTKDARAEGGAEVKKRGRKRTEVDPHKISQRETYYQNRKRREEENKRQRKEEEMKKVLYKETLGDMVEINRTDNVFMNDAMDAARIQFLDFMKTCQEHTDRQRIRIDKLLDEYYNVKNAHDAYKTQHETAMSELRARYSDATTKHDESTKSLKLQLSKAKEELNSTKTLYDQAKQERDEFERRCDKVERELNVLQCDKSTFATMDLNKLNRLQMKWNERLMAINTAIGAQTKERTSCPVCMENLLDCQDDFSLCSIAECGHKICRSCFKTLYYKKCPTCCRPIEESMLAPMRE